MTTKYQQLAEKVAVTFVEAAVVYLTVVPTVNWNKTAIAGAVGAGLSAVYNLVRQSQPTVVATTPVVVVPAAVPVEALPVVPVA